MAQDQLNAGETQQRIVKHRVVSVASEPAELPDQNHVEGPRTVSRLGDHLLKLRSVGGRGALGSVDELRYEFPPSTAGRAPQRIELPGDRELFLGLPCGRTPSVENGSKHPF